jgi:hypothetical protein
MRKQTTILLLITIIMMSIGTATANEYAFSGENVTDGIFREMCEGFLYQETVTWNGEDITLDEAKALYYESHPDAIPKYNTVKHVGHSTVSYKSSGSSSTAPEEIDTSDMLQVVEYNGRLVYAYQFGDNGIYIADNGECFIYALNYGDGDSVVENNNHCYIYVDNRGSGTVTERNNVNCRVVIKNGNVYV